VRKPRDIADAYFLLASDEASFITGTMLSVNGGRARNVGGHSRIFAFNNLNGVRVATGRGSMEYVEVFAGDRARHFDANIRARIPGYETVLEIANAQIARTCPAGAILSVGCGSGQELVPLARRPGYRITAIDPSPDMVVLASARFQAEGTRGVDVRCCTVSDLPDAPQYDAALLCFVLHFIPDDGGKDLLLAQIARRLRPGGALVLLDFCRSENHACDMAALRVYLDWFSKMDRAEADAYVARVSDELHLLPREAYAERAVRAGFSAARQFYACLHVGGWTLERGADRWARPADCARFEVAWDDPALVSSLDETPLWSGWRHSTSVAAPVSRWYADERGFYFHTGSTKSLPAQLRRNPRAEVAFFEPSPEGGKMMRVTGRARFLNEADYRDRLLADRPWLADVKRPLPEAELVVFVVDEGEVHHWNMAVNGREGAQPRTRF
jgi:SAM-dependent methyltransferase/uncharacterized pyridoxamine 5'-phosphate oxidase family protein